MLGRWSLSFLALPLLACGSADVRPSPKPILENSVSLNVGRFGTLACAEPLRAGSLDHILDIVCNETTDVDGNPLPPEDDPFGPPCIYANMRSDEEASEANCVPLSDWNPGPPVRQTLSLSVPHYHGSDTYRLEGSTSIYEPILEVVVSGELVRSAPGSSGIPATQCTLLLTGPKTLPEGGRITGHIRCTDMRAVPWLGGESAAPPEPAIV